MFALLEGGAGKSMLKCMDDRIEQHYTPAQVAAKWALSVDTIRSLFADEPGVLRIDRPEKLHKRRYTSLRIPESVVHRVGVRLATKRKAA